MPQTFAAIAAAFVAGATYISAAVGGFVAAATGSVAIGGAVADLTYAAILAAPRLAVYVGLSLALIPKIPKPEAAIENLKQSIPPRRRAFGIVRTGGPFALWTAKEDFSLNVVVFHDGPINQFLNYYLNDDLVTLVGDVVQTGSDGRYTSPQVRIQSRTGLTPETPYTDLIAKLPVVWTSAHRGDGVASGFLSCQNGKAVHFNHDFPNGEPALSAEYEAQLVYDPRNDAHDPADPSTWDFTAGRNVACQLMTYLMLERGYAYDWSNDEVATFNTEKWERRFANNLTFFNDAADACDEEVALAAGGTEPRYRAGFQYTLDQPESAVVNVLLMAMDGWLGIDGNGGFVLYAGKFTPPSVILTDADLKAFRCDRGVAAENRVNTINGTISDPAKAYNSAEIDPWIDLAGITSAGTPLVEQVDLPQVQSYTQGRRLLKRRMERHKALASGTMTVELSTDDGKSVLGQRFIRVMLSQGPTVMSDLIIEITDNLTIDLNNWTVTFPWISVDPDARDGWTPSEDEGAEPPAGDDSDPGALVKPTIDTISASYAVDPTPRLTLNVTGPDRADLTWEIRWRVSGLTIWQPTEFPDDGGVYPSPVLQTGFVPADVLLEVQTRYETGGGLFSDWSDSSFVDTGAAYLTADSTTITADSTIITADAEP